MTLGFLHYTTCDHPENSSFIQSFEDDRKVVQRTADDKYGKTRCGLTQVPTDIPPKSKKVFCFSMI